MANVSLFTTVKNTSGRACSFGFLGPHGMRLDANETVTLPGDLLTYTARTRTSRRQAKALKSALARGTLTIVQTPTIFLLDATTNATKILGLDNGSLGTANPSWS